MNKYSTVYLLNLMT